MVFSSIPFIFYFLPIFLILYYCVPFCLKNPVLLIFSLIFYAWGEPVYIILMIIETFSDYVSGRLMEHSTGVKRRLLLIYSIIFDLAILCYFKYADFFIDTVNNIFHTGFNSPKLALPVGISFFTFQTLGYIIDVYRGKTKAEHSYPDYLTYVSMFPQLIAGPIVRYEDVSERLKSRKITFNDYSNGFMRFLIGLFKKVLIANSIGSLFDAVLQDSTHTIAAAWLGALAFTLQIYYDFSGYSDMAIGMGQMLGFKFNENFNYPLNAVSVTDFWRRWHISLSGWFRDYVYIPLGGNRVSRLKLIRNIFIVWLLTGLWHGASWNFVIWGLYYCILLLLEKLVYGNALKRCPAIVCHLYSFIIVVVGFVIFAIVDMKALAHYLKSMFGLASNAIIGTDCIMYIRDYGIMLIISLILAFPVSDGIKKRCRKPLAVMSPVLYTVLFILSVAALVNDSYNPFLYFRF